MAQIVQAPRYLATLTKRRGVGGGPSIVFGLRQIRMPNEGVRQLRGDALAGLRQTARATTSDVCDHWRQAAVADWAQLYPTVHPPRGQVAARKTRATRLCGYDGIRDTPETDLTDARKAPSHAVLSDIQHRNGVLTGIVC